MHLLAAQPGSLTDGAEAVDLGQQPGRMVVLSAADTELAALARAHSERGAPFALRLANLLRLGHHMSVDLYLDSVIRHAELVVVRLLGGRGYWPHGVDELARLCRERGIALALLPGSSEPDPELARLSSLEPEALDRLWAYLAQGGPDNARNFLAYGAHLMGDAADWQEPVPLAPAGIYGQADPTSPQGRAVIVFYRALVLAGDTAPIDALLDALRAQGLAAAALFTQSLKEPVAGAMVESMLAELKPDIILNLTGFAVASPGRAEEGPFGPSDCAVLQAVLGAGTEEVWRAATAGLGPRDIAMNVALPEVDGRIITRAISFKQARRDQATQCDLAIHAPVPDRVEFVAQLAANWARLRRKTPKDRRIALVLANYPNRDARLGNGVGLDTPASAVLVLKALAEAGYTVGATPESGNALMDAIKGGVTNDWRRLAGREVAETIALPDYLAFFHRLPRAVQDKVNDRWGAPERDPFFRAGELHCGDFLLPAIRFGKIIIAVQPARGYNIDPASSYHDPDLVPPHNYLAFHAWLREGFGADAVVHLGKHGNLEWLPGKGLALSAECFPEAALGPLPNLYPFIVNDPGEGTQAKRRAAAVIIDHLTPPLTRAESYGPLRDLERLVDEYYDAAGLDPRRLKVLRREILSLAAVAGLDRDLGIAPDDAPDTALQKLDNHLCELKELQIRDGLHIFGQSPQGDQRADLLVALARVRRGTEAHQQSLIQALAADLDLGFDPLDCIAATPWTGPRPAILGGPDPWRTAGDTVERLELLARRLVMGGSAPGPRSAQVLDWIRDHLAAMVDACGAAEMDGLLRGLDGRFVPPGPSGAPSRGRPDVLPTGRNFYSVDARAVPTPAAWSLGWASAQLLVERHFQDHGQWPQAVAVTAWGTSNMRTGGDDIAQGLALMGVRPRWETGSGRVIGFEILPAGLLDRPRVDVTLRISGFFRDAFPDLVSLFDSAARAVAALDEEADVNPLAARVAEDRARLVAQGLGDAEATRQAGYRVFGSKPGAYGAGLQALIDEGGWTSRADLADAYVAWGGWAYGAQADGDAVHDRFKDRLAKVQAVIQNQDNREHDLLDSDDYYQFEGGMAAAVESLAGQAPVVYHPDHSRPESLRIRTLDEEIARIVRGRVVNPKWIKGVMRHGYKGAFEMTASLDYLFAFAATTHAVKDHHFDMVAEAYLEDPEVAAFLAQNNPDALADIKSRLAEAIRRGLWHPRRNSVHALLTGESR
jgi:cobaltochelatase CobN